MLRWLNGEFELPADTVYNMVLEATGDEELAEEHRLRELSAANERDAAAARRGQGGA